MKMINPKFLIQSLLKVLVVIVIVLFSQLLLPKFTTSSVTLLDESNSLQLIANTKVRVIYHQSCSQSPCPINDVVFDGSTNQKGQIDLLNWHLDNLNRCGFSDVVYNCYQFEVEGYQEDYLHIERGGRAFFIYFKNQNT